MSARDDGLDERECERWLRTADQKRAVAGELRRLGFHADACLAYEQAAQLALKAVLRGIGLHERSHDLPGLAQLIEAETGETPSEEVKDGLRELSLHYLPSRYPDAFAEGTPSEHYTVGLSEAAERAADRARTWVGEVWDTLVAERDQTTPHPEGPSR